MVKLTDAQREALRYVEALRNGDASALAFPRRDVLRRFHAKGLVDYSIVYESMTGRRYPQPQFHGLTLTRAGRGVL